MPYRVELEFPGAALVLFLIVPALVLVARWKWRLAAARSEEVMRLVRLASEEAARAEIESAAIVYGSDSSYVYGSDSSYVYGSDSSHVYGSDSSYASGGGEVVRPLCAVCYCPTTTRCSRCKAVRYCSGKCQIIHWRQGHKEACHPPHTDVQPISTGSVSDSKAVQAEKTDLYDDTTETTKSPLERSASADSSFSSANFTGEEDSEGKHFVDTSESTSGSSAVSSFSSFSTFAATVETLDDASARDDPVIVTHARSGEPSSCGVSHGSPKTSPNTTDDVCRNITKSPPYKAASVNLFVNGSSCSDESNKKACGGSTEGVGYETHASSGSSSISSDDCTIAKPSVDLSECQNTSFDSSMTGSAEHVNSRNTKLGLKNDCVQSDSGFSFQFNRNLPGPTSVNEIPLGAVRSEDMGLPKAGDSPALVFDVSASDSKGRRNGECPPKSGGLSSLSSVASADRTSSGSSVDSLTSAKSSDVNSAPTVFTGLPEITNSVGPGSHDIKTSMHRVVQHFRSSKLSEHHPSGFGSGSAGKYNYKMLFPYDLFIKLYGGEKVELRPCGLINCGNSCYANAVLQCLSFTPPLTAYFLQGLHTKTCPKKGWCFTCEFESLVLKAKQGKSPLSPIKILSQMHNAGSNLGHGKEEDAHEFLRYAIDAMQSACLKEAEANAVGPFMEETTLIQLIFGGYLRSKIKCLRCRVKSERRERMMDLTVEINGDIGTLEEALKQFTATEILDGDNKYQCNRCKSYERAKKKLTVLEAPNVLTIALKRFQSGKFGKLNKEVQFPEILNLAPYMSKTSDKSPIYGLYAVVVHLDVMNAAFSGHYVCYVKNTSGKWYKIDDCTVKPVELSRVLSKGAYMLLYARCSPRAPSLIRNAMSRDYGKSKWTKRSETAPREEAAATTKSRSSHTTSQDPPNWTKTGRSKFDPFDRRFLYRLPKIDSSSSDSSSLFGCSDEGSCTTECTRDSTSTDDYSEYIFGESWNSPLRYSAEESDSPNSRKNSASDFSCLSQDEAGGRRTGGISYEAEDLVAAEADGGLGTWWRRPGESSRGRSPSSILHSDTTGKQQCRKLTGVVGSSSSRDHTTDQVNNPCEVKSSVLIRRCTSTTRDRTAQTFYS